MKKIFTLFLLAIIVSFAIDINAQTGQDWKWLNPVPQGNTLRYIKMWDANNWYVIGYAGTFMKTTNAGTTWTFHHKAGGQYLGYTGQSINMYDAHFINQSTGVVVGSSSVNGGIVRTTNGGTTFDTVSGLPTTGIFYQVQFLNTTTGYAVGTVTPKIFVTTNTGVSWTGITTAPTTTVYDIYAFDANNLIISTTSGNVQKSTDAGATWSAVIATGTTTVGNKLHFINANTGYLAGATGKFSFTTDGGSTWTSKTVTVGGVTNTSAYYDIAASPTSIYLTGDAFNIYKTSDNGTTWDTVGFLAAVASQPWTSTYYATALSQTGDTLITAGAFGLVNRRLSASNKQVFTAVKKVGITYDIWAQNSTVTGIILAVGARSSSTSAADQVLRSSDGGATWTVATFPATAFGYLNSIHMINDNTGWACGSVSSLFKTTNGGSSWDSVATPFGIGTLILSKVQFVNANTGWVFTKSLTADSSTIIKTTDGGTTWNKQRLGNGLAGSSNQIYWADMINANTGWIVNYTPRPYKTTDGGNTWAKDSIVDAFGGFMYGIDMVDSTFGYITGSSGRIYKTTNGGALWDTLTKPGNSSPSWYGAKFYNASVGVIVGTNGSTLMTSNGGSNWILQNTGGASVTHYSLCLVPGSVGYTCGTSGFVWKNANLPLVSGIENLSEIPVNFELSQNYPNPFNPFTTINFAIPRAGNVTLKVFDVAGREISSLLNNSRLNPGSFKLNFDGSNLSSGVYFYSLVVDNAVIGTKKMILVK